MNIHSLTDAFRRSRLKRPSIPVCVCLIPKAKSAVSDLAAPAISMSCTRPTPPCPSLILLVCGAYHTVASDTVVWYAPHASIHTLGLDRHAVTRDLDSTGLAHRAFALHSRLVLTAVQTDASVTPSVPPSMSQPHTQAHTVPSERPVTRVSLPRKCRRRLCFLGAGD